MEGCGYDEVMRTHVQVKWCGVPVQRGGVVVGDEVTGRGGVE